MGGGSDGFFGGVRKAWGNFRSGATELEQKAAQSASELKQAAVQKAEQLETKASQAVDTIEQKAGQTVAAVEQGAKELYAEGKVKVAQGVDRIESGAHQVANKAGEVAHQAWEGTKRVVHVADQKLDKLSSAPGSPLIGPAVVADIVDNALQKAPAPVDSKPGPGGLLDNAFVASNAAYTLSKGGKAPDGWTQVTYPAGSRQAELMKACDAYELVAPGGQHFMAFTGTAKGADVAPDVGNFLDIKTKKYKDAAEMGELWKNKDIIPTGHSLGGGEAKTMAATASHGTDGVPAKQVVCIGFDPAPVNSRVLADHGVVEKHPDSINIQVINRHDPLNRFVEGGLIRAGSGQVIADRESKNEVVILAEGKGNAAWISGHRIASLADPHDPNKLVATLSIDGSPIDKAAADRFASAERATANPFDVTKTLEHAAPAQTLKQELTGNHR